jgi:hypothetical protein
VGKTVVAKDGDCVLSIAKAAGFADWHKVYDAPENESLRKKRPDPSTLCAGDRVFIPDFEALTVTLHAAGAYTIHTKSILAEVDLCLNDPSGNPYAKLSWELKVKDRLYKGTTDAEGTVKQKVPADALEGVLTLYLDAKKKKKKTWTIDIGGIAPINTDAGVQGRLSNLGYDCGADEKGKLGKGTEGAIHNFQNDHGLEPTGKLDDATRAKIQEVHNS